MSDYRRTPGQVLDDALADLYAAQEAYEGELADLTARLDRLDGGAVVALSTTPDVDPV